MNATESLDGDLGHQVMPVTWCVVITAFRFVCRLRGTWRQPRLDLYTAFAVLCMRSFVARMQGAQKQMSNLQNETRAAEDNHSVANYIHEAGSMAMAHLVATCKQLVLRSGHSRRMNL